MSRQRCTLNGLDLSEAGFSIKGKVNIEVYRGAEGLVGSGVTRIQSETTPLHQRSSFCDNNWRDRSMGGGVAPLTEEVPRWSAPLVRSTQVRIAARIASSHERGSRI